VTHQSPMTGIVRIDQRSSLLAHTATFNLLGHDMVA